MRRPKFGLFSITLLLCFWPILAIAQGIPHKPTISQYRAPPPPAPTPTVPPISSPRIIVPHIVTPPNFSNPQPTQPPRAPAAPAYQTQNPIWQPFTRQPTNANQLPQYAFSCHWPYLARHWPQKFVASGEANNIFTKQMGALHEQRRFNDSDRTALSSLFTDLVEKLKTDLLGMPDSPSDFEQIVRLETALPSLNQCAVSLSLSADLIGQLETPLTNYYSKAPQIYEPIFQTIASARFNRENFGQYQNLIGAISSTPKLNAAVENSEAKVSFQRAKSNLEIARAQYLGNYFTNEIDRQPKCIVADGPMQIYRSFNVERAYPARAIEREKSGRVSLLL
ncbi:MAG: hypothetical protein AAB680_03370, partial [Pseudomonadota bacterium]